MIRLVVADDFPQMMVAIRLLCAGYGDVELVAEVSRFEDLQEAAQSKAHDIILMDDSVPPLTSAGAVAQLREMGIRTPILFHEAERIRRNLEAGCNGYIVKEEFIEELEPAIRALYRGQSYLSPWARAALEEEPA